MLGSLEGVTYCKPEVVLEAQSEHSGQCCFKAVSKAESFLLQTPQNKGLWKHVLLLPSAILYIFLPLYNS